jgi:hypothetical protein
MVAHAVEALLDAAKARAKRQVHWSLRVYTDRNKQAARLIRKMPSSHPRQTCLQGSHVRIVLIFADEGASRVKHKKAAKTASVVGCDDLLPVLTWVCVQANPPRLVLRFGASIFVTRAHTLLYTICPKHRLARTLWFLNEFRHPEMTGMGEEQYCLAQVVMVEPRANISHASRNCDCATR